MSKTESRAGAHALAPAARPRLYLIAPLLGGSSVPPPLEEAAKACDLACVLLQTPGEGRDAAAALRAIIPSLQKRGIACLVANDPGLAIETGADGVHMEGSPDELAAALRALKPGRIVGAGGIRTRHAAMEAGEAGADYVMLGSETRPLEETAALVSWWAELFNVPCVAYAANLQAAKRLAAAGADFIALGKAYFGDPQSAIEAWRRLSQAPE
ncbi:MAG TPA: thiamine phosphate synthase [Methylocella sp.]|nr:thiamine phosphate synthase [Methylocella sp.]